MTRLLAALITFVAMSGAADAHVGQHGGGVLIDGLKHPFTGIDHLIAMLAVGLWSAQIGGRRQWAWPLAFVAAMVVGGALGRSGASIPFVEPAIAASLVAFGIVVVLAFNAPLAAGAALIAAFAIAHGFAHGAEASDTGFGGYAAGFVTATVIIHLIGIGHAGARLTNATALRALGLLPIAIGAWLLAT